MSVSPLLDALRLATGELHRSLEDDAGVEAALRGRDTRPVMVARFLALHRAVEAGLAPWGAALADCGFAPEPRSPLIARDMAALNASVSATTIEPAVGSLGEALGWVYVAEGSMLGGRVMLKAMRRDGIGTEGLSFLDPHGDETGPRWRAFLRALEIAGARGLATEGDVVTGGCDAFGLARRLLAPDRVLESAA